jgi:hypothetical protein
MPQHAPLFSQCRVLILLSLIHYQVIVDHVFNIQMAAD